MLPGDDFDTKESDPGVNDLAAYADEILTHLNQFLESGNDLPTAVALCAKDTTLSYRILKILKRFDFMSYPARVKETKLCLQQMVGSHHFSDDFLEACLTVSGYKTRKALWENIDNAKFPANTVLLLLDMFFQRTIERTTVFASELAHMPEKDLKNHIEKLEKSRDELKKVVQFDLTLAYTQHVTFNFIRNLLQRSLDPKQKIDLVEEYQRDRTMRLRTIKEADKLCGSDSICIDFQIGKCTPRNQNCPKGLRHVCIIDKLPHPAKSCWKLGKRGNGKPDNANKKN